MTNLQFTTKLRRLVKLNNEALSLQQECEEEYERRYGINPSDADDDTWIDSLHPNSQTDPNSVSAYTVEEGAVGYARLKPYMKNKSEKS